MFLWKTLGRRWEDVVFLWKMWISIGKLNILYFLIQIHIFHKNTTSSQRLPQNHKCFVHVFQHLPQKHMGFVSKTQRPPNVVHTSLVKERKGEEQAKLILCFFLHFCLDACNRCTAPFQGGLQVTRKQERNRGKPAVLYKAENVHVEVETTPSTRSMNSRSLRTRASG